MLNKLKVIKIGGNVIDDEQLLDSFLLDFSQLDGAKILVHGGGKLATKLSDEMGISTEMIGGRRITSNENLSVVTMVYAGLINKNVVAKLQGHHCNALGLSGADANCISATLRKKHPVDYGWVGDVKEVKTDTIEMLLSNGITPVFNAIGHDGEGQLLNTNADTIAAEVAIAMSEVYDTELIYCFEKQGVLSDVNDGESVIPSINSIEYATLMKEGIINEGMLPKMKNCFHALKGNVSKVRIGNTKAILTENDCHTTLSL